MIAINIEKEWQDYKTFLSDATKYNTCVTEELWRHMMTCSIEEYRDICKRILDSDNRVTETPRQ